MATKYSMRVRDAESGEVVPVALFSDLLNKDTLHALCVTMLDYVDGASVIEVIDLDTGEVVTNVECYFTDDDDCDNDCGYDPYLGCFTDDC